MKVSVYIPCFNAQAYIGGVLDAVFKQTLLPDEVIVVDDCSNDNTAEIALKYPVRLIRHQGNRGLAAARNSAVKNTDAEFIAALDADCLPQSQWLERLMNKLNDRKISGAGGKMLEANSDNIYDSWRSVHMKQHWGQQESSPEFLFGSNTLFRVDALRQVGLYNEKYRTNYEDVELCMRLKEKGLNFIYEPKAICYHFKRDNICSLLNSYWQWRFGYYQREKFYANEQRFLLKIMDAIYLGSECINADILANRKNLFYLDFLMVLHHLLKDFEYFILQGNQADLPASREVLWLSMVDLVFFNSYDSEGPNLGTFLPIKNAVMQNFFALNLCVGNILQEKFKQASFTQQLFKHLFLCIYRLEDEVLLGTLINLIQSNNSWRQMFNKDHPNFISLYLRNLNCNLENWLDNLEASCPGFLEQVKASAANLDT